MATRGVNKVILIGNLGADPEVRFSQNGQGMANMNLATSESWQDKMTGETREKTEWHRVVLFGKLAEIAGQYLKKGAQVYIEGQLQTRKWQDQNGVERYTTEVVVNPFGGVMQMLGGRNAMQQETGQMDYAQAAMPNNAQAWGQSAQNNARPAAQNKKQYNSSANQFSQPQGNTNTISQAAPSFESHAPFTPEPSVQIDDEDIPF